MIPALGAGGREFDSRITPLFVVAQNHTFVERFLEQKDQAMSTKKGSSPMWGSDPRLAG
jgi:hypothetical protein